MSGRVPSDIQSGQVRQQTWVVRFKPHLKSLRGKTPADQYKEYNTVNCVKATGHFNSECCFHNGIYDVFNADVACCSGNGPQPKGNCETHDSSDLWHLKILDKNDSWLTLINVHVHKV